MFRVLPQRQEALYKRITDAGKRLLYRITTWGIIPRPLMLMLEQLDRLAPLKVFIGAGDLPISRRGSGAKIGSLFTAPGAHDRQPSRPRRPGG